MSTFNKILVPVDFSEESQQALLLGCDLAKRYEAELLITHVYLVPSFATLEGSLPAPANMRDAIEEGVNSALESQRKQAIGAGVRKVSVLAREGIAHSEIVAIAGAEQVDLIVIGTHGRTGLKHVLLGSVAERVLRHALCPVLAARALGKRG
jgi:universal stress protein A